MGRLLAALAFVAALAGCGGEPNSLFDAAGYHVRDGVVYYLNAFPGDAVELEQADADSFETLDRSYAKDDDAVYLDGAVVPDADPATFELLDEPNYTRDDEHVFLSGRVLTEDVTGFAFLEGGGLTKDGAHVYWSDGTVLSDDPAHFAIVSDADHYLFTKDASTVHVNGNPIPGADPASFRVDSGAYTHDAGGVFYFTDAIPDADASSFEVLEGSYARDEARAYWMGKVIPGADPASFVVLNGDFECTADATRAFYQDTVIRDFDPGAIPEGATVTNCSGTSLSFS